MFIEKNLQSFKDDGYRNLGLATESDTLNVKALLEELYNDDEGESLLDQYKDVKDFVTN